jgi:SAM-dependent methyltransferase
MSLNLVLKCQKCKSVSPSIQVNDNELVCMKCNERFIKEPEDDFYNFYSGSKIVEGSLLSEEKQDFLINQAFASISFKANLNELQNAVLKVNGAVMLDIGCGNGRYSYYFKDILKEYYGLEPSLIPAHRIVKNTNKLNQTIFIHYSTEIDLPVHSESVDIVTFIASYDHIPDVAPIVKNAWGALKPGGTMIINMQNYDFWIKRLLRKIISKRRLQNEDDHFRVHSPNTLVKEIYSVVNPISYHISSDFFYLPNLPKKLGWLYFSTGLMSMLNGAIRLILKTFRICHSGSAMIVSFKKGLDH